MYQRFLCGDCKYEAIGSRGPNDVIGLPISLTDLPEEINVNEETFYLPSPFHVSLVYIERIIEKYNISIPDFADKVVNDFCDFTRTNNIEITCYKDEYRIVNRDDTKKTVVVMCEVSNLDKFFDLINKKYGLNIKYQATHVTLYNTLKGKPGIHLMDEDDIKNITKPISNPIGFSLQP